MQVSPLFIEGRFAWGWAHADSHSAQVHLYVDGRQVAVELTGQPLPAAAKAFFGNSPPTASGFAFALPDSVFDGFEHDLHAAIPTSDGEGVHGAAISFQRGDRRGQVRQEQSVFSGVVWFDSHEPKTPSVDVAAASGEPIRSIELLVSRTREPQGFPARFNVRCDELPAALLHFRCGDIELAGSPLVRQQAMLGVLEKVDIDGVRGWALDAADIAQPVELVLRVDGKDAAWFRPNVRRAEIAHHLKDRASELGFTGFEIRLPEGVADGQAHRISVHSAATGELLQDGTRIVRFADARKELAARGISLARPRAVVKQKPVVSVVILNRNGCGVLRGMLESWEAHNRTVPSEIIVIDHASTDGSVAMLQQWKARLAIEVIALRTNESFSSSSNLGASRARGEFLLFLNNDVVWLQDALPRMVQTLAEPRVGIVGMKLLKAVGESVAGKHFATEVQHLGVRFKLHVDGYRPYEAGVSAEMREEEHEAQHVPVVTGAALLCRAKDFRRVGGFSEDYFYGFEDVEFCLRLSQRLRMSVVCRNDCVALHHHGHTRLSGRQMSIFDRVLRNSAVLDRDIGLWIKQAYWRSLCQGDGYITREPLTFGVVSDASEGEIAARIQREFPHAKVVALRPGAEWKNVSGIHVLAVGDARYDVRSLQRARSDLLVIAMPNDSAVWASVPWLADFDVVLEEGGSLAKTVQGAPWRLRVQVVAARGRERDAAQLLQMLRDARVPCWQGDRGKRMADVVIALPGAAASRTAKQRPDVLNVEWRAGSTMPTVQSLAEQMEARIGSSFNPP